MLIPLLQLNLEVGSFDLFKHSPAPFGFTKNSSVSLLQYYLILFKDLQCKMRQVFIQHLALVVDVDPVMLTIC